LKALDELLLAPSVAQLNKSLNEIMFGVSKCLNWGPGNLCSGRHSLLFVLKYERRHPR